MTPVQISEQPWTDPLDGVREGTYRRFAADGPPSALQHLVVYLRPDDGRERCAELTACGRPFTAIRPTQLERTCADCVAGLPQAFRAERARDGLDRKGVSP